MTFRPSEKAAILAAIAPISQGVGTANSGWIPVTTFRKIMAMILTGVLGASATVDAKLQQATSAAGAGAKDVTGKAITQLTKAAADDGKQVIIDLDAAELDIAGGFAYVQLSITVGTAASLVGAVLLGFDGRYEPASDLDASSVKQIVY
ncbi:MAG TPA: hypothetical protein PL117_03190 [Accumulibacter sp.]|uniref:hypothetical protein n=1 Tax=Accumulibacter sp. TaxID=2053492 RepID=UPI002CDE9AAC|nr:hypothetical protein [Accumulibacter sp.]HRF71752.1 hypothetical protein [Accumulibacter sp.]